MPFLDLKYHFWFGPPSGLNLDLNLTPPLTQLIDIPTRTATLTINEIKHTTVSLIELIFTNNEDNITKHGTTDPIADHDGIFVSFHCKMSKEKVISKDVFDYKNIDEIGLRNYIKAIYFQSSVFTQPIKEQANEMTKILQSALKKFVPIKKILTKCCKSLKDLLPLMVQLRLLPKGFCAGNYKPSRERFIGLWKNVFSSVKEAGASAGLGLFYFHYVCWCSQEKSIFVINDYYVTLHWMNQAIFGQKRPFY